MLVSTETVSCKVFNDPNCHFFALLFQDPPSFPDMCTMIIVTNNFASRWECRHNHEHITTQRQGAWRDLLVFKSSLHIRNNMSQDRVITILSHLNLKRSAGVCSLCNKMDI